MTKPIYTIQQTPKGEWRVTKGALSYVFPTEPEALKCMYRMINNTVKSYDKDGNPLT